MSQKYKQKYHVGNPTEVFEFEIDTCAYAVFSFQGVAQKAAINYNKNHKEIQGWMEPIILTLLEIPGGQRSFKITLKKITIFEAKQIKDKKIE